MAVRGRPFKKGQSGNPGGRAKLPEDLRKSSELSRAKFIEITNKYLFFTKEQLGALTRDPSTPIIDLLICSILHQAVVKGDERRLDFVLNRLIGKVKDELDVRGIEGGPRVIVHLPSNGSENDA